MTSFEELPPGESGLLSARPGPDLAEHGYREREYVARGTATSYAGHDPADFATRVVVRRPESPGDFSGTVVVEWLNVSSGADAAPDWIYLAAEIVRRGHVWVGVSAQYIGVEGGDAAVGVGEIRLPALRDSERYAARLSHPGDAYCYDIYTAVATALDGLLDDLVIDVRLAVGESQSAYALTTYANQVQPRTGAFDGFLIHSRGAEAMSLGEPGRGIDLAEVRTDSHPTPIRDDLEAPVLVLETEGDLFGRMSYLPARQPDSEWLRLWEVAGTAHADHYVIGDFEEILGCPRPVNRGQQAYVARAALRQLDAWARGETTPPHADRLEIGDGECVRNENGNARGGVRTPAVVAPVELLRGDTEPGASAVCQLFGSTLPMDPARLRALYPAPAAYLAAYAQAADAAIAAGFVLAEDRDELLTEARPDLVATAHGDTAE